MSFAQVRHLVSNRRNWLLCPLSDWSVPQALYERAVFLDTSALIELQVQNPEAIDCRRQIDLYHVPTFTTTLVVAETHRRLLYDHGKALAFSFLSGIFADSITIIRHDKPVDNCARDLVSQYWDLNLPFCDAVSFAVMLKFGIFRSFTYDCNHFRALGFITYPPFYL
jgi:predicted nucleic acid-binding protein